MPHNATTVDGPATRRSGIGPAHLAILAALLALTAATGAINYLLFHTVAELFAIVVGFLIGTIGWYTFRFSRNHLLAFLAMAYPFIAIIDLFHTLAYQGMGVFADGANLPTQLWIAGRLLEATALLLAPTFLVRTLRPGYALAAFGAAAALLLGLIGFGRFPDMYLPGSGLTETKIAAEYLVIALLAAAGFRLWRRRARMDVAVLRLIAVALVFTMLSELLFTFYIGVYDLSNMLGHLSKVVSFWLVFVALVRTSLVEPFHVLSRNSTTYDAIPEEIAVVDTDGAIRQVNRVIEQHYAGVRLGEHCHERFHPALPRTTCPACRAIVEARSVERMELFYPGEERWRELTLSPIRDPVVATGMVHVLREVTERKRNEAELQRLNRALRAISASNQALIHADDEGRLLDEVCTIVVSRGGYRMAWVGYLSEAPGFPVQPQAWAGEDAEFLSQARFSWGDNERGSGPVGSAARSGEVAISNDIASDPACAPWRAEALRHGFAATIVFPLLDADKRPRGVLAIYAEETQAFSPPEVRILTELAGDLGYGINALRAGAARASAEARAHEWQQRLAGTLKQTVQALAGVVEQRDPYTAGHQRRVAELAVAIGREVRLDERRLEGLLVAGLVHDVGKIHVPAEILARPGRLSELEFNLVQAHTKAGFEILKDVSFPWPVAEAVYQHHERLDGSGYPRGLAGPAIALEARIIAVADVVDAIASHRPYRAARGVEAALSEIEAGAGRVYDADVVAACVRLFREGGFGWADGGTPRVGRDTMANDTPRAPLASPTAH